MRIITAGENEAGMRLDRFIEKLLPNAGKGFAYKMLRKKNIVVNGAKADGSARLKAGDEIKLFISDETYEALRGEAVPVKNDADSGYDITADIIYEDSDVLLVHKPAGLLTQKAGKDDISLNDHLLRYYASKKGQEPSGTFRPSVCNRLDRNTAGLVCCGMSMKGLRELSEMFRDRTPEKYYLAVCMGSVTEEAHVRAWLKKDERTNKVTVYRKECEGAEYIETSYRPLAAKDGMTLLEVRLHTGKSHQIRAQLSADGHPLAGDPKYGDAAFNRRVRDRYGVRSQMLAAYRIVFPEDTGLVGIAGKEFTDEKAVDAPLWKFFRQQ